MNRIYHAISQETRDFHCQPKITVIIARKDSTLEANPDLILKTEPCSEEGLMYFEATSLNIVFLGAYNHFGLICSHTLASRLQIAEKSAALQGLFIFSGNQSRISSRSSGVLRNWIIARRALTTYL
jgi:hypothetical protein